MAASATVNIKEYKSTQIPDNIVLSQQYHHGPIILNQVAIKDLQDQGYLFVYPVKSIITWSTTSVPLAILPMSQTSRRRWRISTEVWDSRGSILAYISLYPCGWWRKAASGRTTSMNPTGVIWNYHVPVTIDRAMKDDRTEHLMKIGHAGLHLLCSSRPLEAAVKQGIIDACLASGTTIASPSTIPGKRFRGHPEHHIYLKEMLEYIRDSHRPSKEEHPSVPSHHFDEPVDEIEETIWDANLIFKTEKHSGKQYPRT